jgi:3-oxoisoapionate decarboxylase
MLLPGLGSFAFGWAIAHRRPPFDEQSLLEFASLHGLSVVQLGDNLPLHDMPTHRRESLVLEARRQGIQLEVGARGFTETHLATYVDLCREVGATLLRFVIDLDGYAPAVSDVMAIARNAVPELRAANVVLALENHDRFTAATLRAVIDGVGSQQVGICLDSANSLGAGEGLAAVTALLADVTVNMHLKDVAITRLPHQMGFVVEGRPLGCGTLPLADAVARVRAAGRCRTVILESWTPPGASVEDTISSEVASAEISLSALRKLVES